MLYYAITLMRKFTDKSFELVIDLTMSSASNEPDVSNDLCVFHKYLFHEYVYFISISISQYL